MQYVLLVIGVCLIASSITLLFLQREKVSAAILLLPGVVLCLIDVPGVDTVAVNLVGMSASFKRQLAQVVTDTKLDIKQEDTGPIKLDIQKLKDALTKQDTFNKSITLAINKLEANPSNGGPQLSQPNINSTSSSFAANNQYSIFLFYRETRADDSKLLLATLIAAGFQTSAIVTTLAEAQIGPQPDASTFIIPTDKGTAVGSKVEQILRQTLPSPRNSAVTLGSPYPVKRGDVQILLY